MPRTKYRIRRSLPIKVESPAAPSDTLTDQPVPPATKTCTICRLERPISEFRRRSKNGQVRHCYCHGCRKLYESDRRFAQRHGKIAQFNAIMAKNRLDDRAVVQLCHKLFSDFRGLDNFARQWNEHLRLAMRQTPGRKYVVDAFGALMALIRFADEYRERHRPDLGGMSDEELKEHLRSLLGVGEVEGIRREEEEQDADA